jgi:hypothetical protein
MLLTLAGWTSPKIAEAFGVREANNESLLGLASGFSGCAIGSLFTPETFRPNLEPSKRVFHTPSKRDSRNARGVESDPAERGG